MPMNDEQRKRIADEARRRGQDPARAVSAAEKRFASKAAPEQKDAATGAQPASALVVDRLLIGYLPFVKVRELRMKLGFTDRIADDEMTCLQYQLKYGGVPTATVSEGEAE